MQKHEDENTTLAEMMNCVQELDYPTEESKKELIHESFKIDENEISNRDEKHKGEVNQNVPGKLLDSGVAS